jgi:hypothetical protein
MRRTLMKERLAAVLDQAEHIVVMAMTRIRMIDIMRVQIVQPKLWVPSELRPFLRLHDFFYHIQARRVLQNIALFDNRKCNTLAPHLVYTA